MCKYEIIDPESDCLGSQVFLCEPLRESIGPEIFDRGQRVKNYMALLKVKVVCHLVMMDRLFLVPDGSFNQCLSHFNMRNIMGMKDLCSTKRAKELFECIRVFQRNAVKDWHPFVDEVTKVLLCGVIGVNEADGEGAATCKLDLAL
jgi:hypothetical protein